MWGAQFMLQHNLPHALLSKQYHLLLNSHYESL